VTVVKFSLGGGTSRRGESPGVVYLMNSFTRTSRVAFQSSDDQ